MSAQPVATAPRRTVLRLVDAPTFPAHLPGRSPDRARWPQFRGRPVEVYLPPETPDGFTCDTPVAWRVPDDWLHAHGLTVTAVPVYVCWHQVEVD